MNSLRQNISVLPTKVLTISGTTVIPEGIVIPLGVPSSGNFNGLISGWTTTTFVTNALDQINKQLVYLTGTTALRTTKQFNSTSDWTGPIDGYYTITFLASNHNKGPYPSFSIQELISSSYYDVITDSVSTNSIGDIVFSVIDNPDGRFSGRIIVI